MKNSVIILFFCLPFFNQAQLLVQEVAHLPEKVTNNAVCEGYINDFPLIFSFGGIDSTLEFSGIHQRSYRYNILTDEVQRIPDLPDTSGKIASAASRIGNIIYIMGGYHVLENGTEITSNKVHRYDITQNIFLSDGENIPVPVDDHVQMVWNDSLIYLITGWSNTANVQNVQIYDPKFDQWLIGKPLPNLNLAKSFGASGSIINDTIYFFGGASSASNFPIQSALRKGVIDHDNPTEIEWNISTPDRNIVGYRMASTVVQGQTHWVGGSNQSYNFDALSYQGSRTVSPNNRDLFLDNNLDIWQTNDAVLPMDLRGIGNINDSIKYLIGGIETNREVSNKILRLFWSDIGTGIKEFNKHKRMFYLYPNPYANELRIQTVTDDIKVTRIELFTMQGIKVLDKKLNNSSPLINLNNYRARAYIIRIWDSHGNSYVDKILHK